MWRPASRSFLKLSKGTMKLTFISFYHPQDKMAASARLRRMLNFFADQGWSLALICPQLKLQAEGKRVPKINKLKELISAFISLPLRAFRENTDFYYISAPPMRMMVIAFLLNIFSGKKVIFEARDLQTINPLLNFRLLRINSFTRFIERWLLLHAKAVVVTTEEIKAALEKEWPEIRERKSLYVIYNGFWKKDYEEFGTKPRTEKTGPLKIIHMGNFYGSRNPQPLLEALKILRQNHPDMELTQAFRFIFLGNFASHQEQEDFLKEAARHRFSALFDLQNLKPPHEALEVLHQSDIGLIITHTSGSEIAIPSKMFEYIAMEKPILAITQDAPVVQAMHKHELGWDVPHEKTQELAQCLYEIWKQTPHLRTKTFPGLTLEEYDFELQLHKLNKILNQL